MLTAMNLIRLGITNVFKGLREGDMLLLVGGLLIAFVSWRRSRSPKRKAVQSIKIKPGETTALRVTAKGAKPIDF